MRKFIFNIFAIAFICILLLSGCVQPSQGSPELHVYIAFGQSNMQGPGTIRTQDKENISDRYQVMNVVSGTYAGVSQTKGQWYKAVPPLIIPDNSLNHWTNSFTIGLSPVDYFGRTLVNKTPNNITIGVIAVANGDMALASFHKTKAAEYFAAGSGGEGRESGRPSSTERSGWTRYTGAGYTNLYHAIKDNAKKAQEEGGIIKGIIFHQGESGRGLTYTTWHEMLKEIYNDMLSDLGLAPNSIPILLGQTFNSGTGPGGYLNTNNNLIKAVIPNAWVISSSGLTQGRVGQGQPDGIHFGSADLEEFGKRYGDKMYELVY
ncbi:MAG: sialate O-acetylesterase [Treponema sp.]|nr:sialate O-acetylesterase [Treponema sp.]